MKEIKTSHDLTYKISDEDFEAVSQFNWFAYRIAGKSHTGKVYLYGFKIGRKVTENGKQRKIWLHNFLMNPGPGLVVDHKDGDPLNNQRDNLRVATVRENSQNRGKRGKNKTSQFLGVCKRKNKKKFSAQIKIDNKETHLGFFEDERDAARAYNAKALELFGEFARLNVIE